MSAPASWLLQRAEAEGSVKGALFFSAFIEANAETLDGFFRLCQARCLKRGQLDEKESWSISLLLYARAHVGEGRCGEGTDPLWRVVEDAGFIGGCNQGGANSSLHCSEEGGLVFLFDTKLYLAFLD